MAQQYRVVSSAVLDFLVRLQPEGGSAGPRVLPWRWLASNLFSDFEYNHVGIDVANWVLEENVEPQALRAIDPVPVYNRSEQRIRWLPAAKAATVMESRSDKSMRPAAKRALAGVFDSLPEAAEAFVDLYYFEYHWGLVLAALPWETEVHETVGAPEVARAAAIVYAVRMLPDSSISVILDLRRDESLLVPPEEDAPRWIREPVSIEASDVAALG